MQLKYVGIMSMHRVRNHGSFLQAYALKRMLESAGFITRFVDIEKVEKPAQKNTLWRKLSKIKAIDRYFLKRVIYKKDQQKMKDLFLQEQRECLGLDALWQTADGCDAVVIGSDEIFNCDAKSEFAIAPERFGWIPQASKVITYSASCGYSGVEDVILEQDKKAIIQGLNNLDAVSVRDENTAKFVAALCEKEIHRHLDPVLVYEFAEELVMTEHLKLPKEPYMVVYAYHNRIHDKAEIKAVSEYARKKGLKTIAVGGIQVWCDEYAVLTPFEVLHYFKNASCIVTDTFHGTIMSAKFNKNFAVLVRKNNANKLDDLLERVHLQSHKALDSTMISGILETNHDYARFNQCIEREKARSREYLVSALK